ncbi:MAG: oxalurate catabolism protein HpxZ [Rhodoblastus sp.]|nr:oxalurate catabolism protein HpxZ [Rhodoblastus sp.]
MMVNDPETLAEVEAEFARYEIALTTNDIVALDGFFWRDARAIRYGGGENLYGFDEIAAFRAARSPAGLKRDLARTVITTFGRHMATASTLFTRTSAPDKVGRQMQTWARMPEGWRIVAAHVSLIQLARST